MLFEAIYQSFLATLALGMCLYMILPLLRRAPKKVDPLKEYDLRPLTEKVDEYIRLTRLTDLDKQKIKTRRSLDRRVWDQKYQMNLKPGDPDKKLISKIGPMPTTKIDRAPILTRCDPAHRKSELCWQCERKQN